MKRYIFSIIVSALLFNVSTLSQPTIEVLGGIHIPVGLHKDLLYNFLEDYWKPSLNLGVRTNIPLANIVNLSPSVSYNYYLFNKYYHQGASIEEEFVASSGESSEVFRMILELQLIGPSVHLLRPYIEIGGGYIYEKVGTIHGRMEYLGSVEYPKDIGGSNENYFAYTIGLGSLVSLSTDFYIDISAKYYSNTTDRSYILYSLGISYKILN
jgi:hypothetical protein